MKTINLAPGERVIAAVPEYCSGPGWSNSVLWVYIETPDKRLRTEALQPAERSAEQHMLFNVAETAHRAMLSTIKTRKKKP